MGLRDVVELMLDKGLVIDAAAQGSLVGVELLTIDAQVTVASVDTFLRIADATNRLDLHSPDKRGTHLPELLEACAERPPHGQRKKQAPKALDPAAGKVKSVAEQVEDFRRREGPGAPQPGHQEG